MQPMQIPMQSSSQSSNALTGILGLGCFFLFFVFSMLVLAFWIWMIVDCVKNEPSEGNDKVIWLLVIILAGGIGALIYFFVRRPQRQRLLGQ